MSTGNNNNHRESNDDPQTEKYRQLFLGGLNYETTEETLKQHFGQWGDIVDCAVMKLHGTNKSRGFGFITYKTAEMLDDAQTNRPHKIDNKKIDTKRATPRDQSRESRISVKKMFVGGLKDDTAEDDIREVFGHFGKIEKLELIKDKNTGKQRGFCFITFQDFDSVDKCVLRQRISVAGKSVEVKKAVSKNQDDGLGGGRGRGGSRGGMRGRGGGSNNGYHQGNYGYAGNMGGNGGYESYGDWHQGDYNGGMGDNNGWNRNDFNSGYNNFGPGYGSGYSGGPTRSTGYSQRGAGPYKNGRGMGNGNGRWFSN